MLRRQMNSVLVLCGSVIVLLVVWATVKNPVAPPPRVLPPSVDAEAAGKAAIAQYDADGDGAISGSELDRCPALKAVADKIAPDGKITSQKIATRINWWHQTKIGCINLTGRVSLDGEPLVGATVTLVPEKFLGPAFQPSSAITNNDGKAIFTKSGTLPGVAYGFYRVEISKRLDGKKTIPARYNTQSELGVEIAGNTAEEKDELEDALKFDLKSR